MSVSPILDYSQLTGYSGDATEKSKDLLDKDVFLNLLMTQMKNQDPLDPMDNQQFLDQLASLATVEELRNSNNNLMTLQLYNSSINNAQSVSMIGKEVKARGDTAFLESNGQPVKLHFLADTAGTSADVNIYNETGDLVRTLKMNDVQEGLNEIRWDGADRNGSPLAAGTYTFEVTAKDSNGAAVTTTTLIDGVVDGVSFESGGPELMIDGQKVAIGDVFEVGQ